jgi:predicted AAA+ superfamily ATPase
MYARLIEPRVREILTDTPVALLVGPRRSGKTTLVQRLCGVQRRYLTLDDAATMAAARGDPVGFIRELDTVAIDEVQRAPELILAIKRSVDIDRRPGRFLLTGSANVMALPRVEDSLAGRIETAQLLPLSRVEIQGRESRFLDSLFRGRFEPPGDTLVGSALVDVVVAGGYPEAIARTDSRRRQDWARAYFRSHVLRDLRDIADVVHAGELPRFIAYAAEHSGQLINYARFGAAIGVTQKTGRRYIDLLCETFLMAVVPPWHTNAIARIVKTPKLHFIDSGVLASARRYSAERFIADRAAFGAVLESFVFAEIMKLASWSGHDVTPFHFRGSNNLEVDFVLERDDGLIAGVEVKASATVAARDFAGLRLLAEAARKKFAFGVVLYDGDAVIPFGQGLAAVPLSSLWN